MLLLKLEGNTVPRATHARAQNHRSRLLHSAPETRGSCPGKRQERPSVYLFHENAIPHVAKSTHQKIEELGWDSISHPPYSPDIAPSDCHLFHSLRAFLAKEIFTQFAGLSRTAADFFDSRSSQFWEEGPLTCPLGGPLRCLTVVIILLIYIWWD